MSQRRLHSAAFSYHSALRHSSLIGSQAPCESREINFIIYLSNQAPVKSEGALFYLAESKRRRMLLLLECIVWEHNIT